MAKPQGLTVSENERIINGQAVERAISLPTERNMAQEIGIVKRESFNHWTVHTEIEIDAPAARVWAVLTDFDSMASWSSTFQNFAGDFRDGGRITLSAKFNGRISQVDHQIFLKEGEEFGWNDTKTMGAADHHLYKVEDLGNGKTRFIQSDKQEGGMAWLMGPLMFHLIVKNMYMTFNRELKAQVEKTAQAEPRV